jgi:hypothetical protein
MLFGVAPFDPLTFAAVVVLLLAGGPGLRAAGAPGDAGGRGGGVAVGVSVAPSQ